MVEFSGREYLIVPIVNLPSIFQYGIMSHDECAKLPHLSVANLSVQERRDHITVPNGLPLHQYANLYFDARNPMMFVVTDGGKDTGSLCVLEISSEVLKIEGTVLTDMNAAKGKLVRYHSPSEINLLPFDQIYARYWVNPDRSPNLELKGRKCAEILVPKVVEARHIVAIHIARNNVQIHNNYGVPIYITPDLFFCRR
jgi:hypothetical protein